MLSFEMLEEESWTHEMTEDPMLQIRDAKEETVIFHAVVID